jgi:hypothetical protein
MDWYYAEGQEKRGPLPESQMRALVAAETIKPATLVWNAGLTQWKPARDTTLFGGAMTAPGTEPQRCIITGKLYPVSQMIQTQHGWVSVEGKEVYYQSLREGAPLPTAVGAANARRDGKRIVVPVGNARLPLRCVKTNAAVTEAELVNKKLYWCTPLAAITILISILIYLILYLILRKLVQLDIPISTAGRGIVRKHAAIAWATVLGGIAAIVIGCVNTNLVILVFLGILMLLGGLIYGSVKASALRVTKLKDGEAWLAGACPDFLAALPPYA